MDVKQTDGTNQTQEATPVKTKDGLPVNEFNQSMKPISLWDDAWRRLKKNKMALTGLFIVGFYAALSLLAPLLPIYSYSEQTIIHQNLPPSLSKAGDMMVRVLRADMMRTAKKEGRADLSEKQKEELAALQQEVANNPVHNRRYLLGTDALGRDMLARVVYGGRISIMIGLIGTITSLFIGVLVGAVSGYFAVYARRYHYDGDLGAKYRHPVCRDCACFVADYRARCTRAGYQLKECRIRRSRPFDGGFYAANYF